MSFWGNIVYLRQRSVICSPSAECKGCKWHYKGANKQYSRKKSFYYHYYQYTRPNYIQISNKLYIYILLTKCEGRTWRILARGLDSMDRVQRSPYKKGWGPIFSQYGPEQAWLIRDLLHNCKLPLKRICILKIGTWKILWKQCAAKFF